MYNSSSKKQLSQIFMKIFFSTSPRAKRDYLDNINKIYKSIRDLDHILTDDTIEKIEEDEFNNWDSDQRQAYFKKTMKAIKDCDVAIFEASFPSLSAGYLIGQALRANKPCIVLFTSSNKPYILDGAQNDKILLLPYTLDNLKKELENALSYAKEQNDVRFNFFISPSILQYLDWIANNRNIPRSVYLRNLIESDMKNNEEYNS